MFDAIGFFERLIVAVLILNGASELSLELSGSQRIATGIFRDGAATIAAAPRERSSSGYVRRVRMGPDGRVAFALNLILQRGKRLQEYSIRGT